MDSYTLLHFHISKKVCLINFSNDELKTITMIIVINSSQVSNNSFLLSNEAIIKQNNIYKTPARLLRTNPTILCTINLLS